MLSNDTAQTVFAWKHFAIHTAGSRTEKVLLKGNWVWDEYWNSCHVSSSTEEYWEKWHDVEFPNTFSFLLEDQRVYEGKPESIQNFDWIQSVFEWMGW